jgi:hypothetical protein
MHVDYGTLFYTLLRAPFLVSPSGSRIDDICCQYNWPAKVSVHKKKCRSGEFVHMSTIPCCH